MNKKHTEKEFYEMNYNDRPDGYGVGPPEYMDDKLPYEKDRKKIPDMGRDDFGLRNQYGPVDQYSFRDIHERRWSSLDRWVEIKKEEEDWKEWDLSKYDYDKYSTFTGPNHHGNMVGKGPKGYQRSDQRVYEDVCESFKHSPDLDASHIVVKVKNGNVYLQGHVYNRFSKRVAELLTQEISGVVGIENELRVEEPYPH